MIVTMLFTVEGARPEISRCVNVESDLDLSRLAQIIDASLGFSGAAGHLFIHQDETKREVFAENPGPGERSMSSMQPRGSTILSQKERHWRHSPTCVFVTLMREV